MTSARSLEAARRQADWEFLHRLSCCVADAAARCALLERRSLALAGRSLELEFAGSELMPGLLEFFVKESGSVQASEFVIKGWDSHSSGVEPPPPPSFLFERGSPRKRKLALAYSPVSNTLEAHAPGCGVGYYWARHPCTIAGWEIAAPLRSLLAGWTESWGGVLAHGAVVGSAAKGILLAGASGAGKSTSALACAVSGMGFMGDDAAILTLQDGVPVAHAVYRTAKLARHMLDSRLPSLRAFETPLVHDRGKAILAFPSDHPGLLAECRIGAIVVQSVASSEQSRLERVSAGEALRALAPSTLLQCAGVGQAALNALARVVAGVPCYRLEAGSDLDGVANMLGDLGA